MVPHYYLLPPVRGISPYHLHHLRLPPHSLSPTLLPFPSLPLLPLSSPPPWNSCSQTLRLRNSELLLLRKGSRIILGAVRPLLYLTSAGAARPKDAATGARAQIVHGSGPALRIVEAAMPPRDNQISQHPAITTEAGSVARLHDVLVIASTEVSFSAQANTIQCL